MILRMDDISAFVANWEDKASNIKFIQESLNIGFDSMVFIDDNPFERNMVKTVLPDSDDNKLIESLAKIESAFGRDAVVAEHDIVDKLQRVIIRGIFDELPVIDLYVSGVYVRSEVCDPAFQKDLSVLELFLCIYS